MKITERRLRSIIRDIIKENEEFGTWNDTQGKLDTNRAKLIVQRNKKAYKYPEDFNKLEERMPGNYPLLDPDNPELSPAEKIEQMKYGEHVDAFIPEATYVRDNKRFVIIRTMVSPVEYFEVQIPN